MEEAEGIKTEKRIDRVILMLAAFPAAVAGIVILIGEAALSMGWIGGDIESCRTFQKTLLAIYVLVMNFGFVVLLYRQKHTYHLRFREKERSMLSRCLCFIWEGIFGPLLFFYVILFPTGFFAGLPAWVLTLAATHVGTDPRPYETSAMVLYMLEVLLLAVAATFTILGGISAVSRSFWVSGVKRHLENLPTSKTRSAAMGLVEVRGRAFRGPDSPDDMNRPVLGLNPLYCGALYIAEPFIVADATGDVLIDPPREEDYLNPRFYLNPDRVHGQPVLMEGEHVYVLGALETDAEIREVIRPWHPPYGMLYKKIRSRLGRLGKRLAFFDSEDFMIVAAGNEAEARGKFFRSRYRWALAGLFFITGGGVILTVAFSAAFGATFF